jgi:rootletin
MFVVVYAQNSTLKDQLSQELRRRQQYFTKSARAGEEIRDIRSILDTSLSTVGRDMSLDPMLLEHETRKLDESLDLGGYRPRHRSPGRTHSPGRGGLMVSSTPAFRPGRSPRSPILRKKLIK